MKHVRWRWSKFAALIVVAGLVCCGGMLGREVAPWEASNPVIPIPDPPLGIGTEKNAPAKLTEFPDPPTPRPFSSSCFRCGCGAAKLKPWSRSEGRADASPRSSRLRSSPCWWQGLSLPPR